VQREHAALVRAPIGVLVARATGLAARLRGTRLLLLLCGGAAATA
jgi:hypothetical protein